MQFKYFTFTIPEQKLPILNLMKNKSILPMENSTLFTDFQQTQYEIFVLACSSRQGLKQVSKDKPKQRLIGRFRIISQAIEYIEGLYEEQDQFKVLGSDGYLFYCEIEWGRFFNISRSKLPEQFWKIFGRAPGLHEINMIQGHKLKDLLDYPIDMHKSILSTLKTSNYTIDKKKTQSSSDSDSSSDDSSDESESQSESQSERRRKKRKKYSKGQRKEKDRRKQRRSRERDRSRQKRKRKQDKQRRKEKQRKQDKQRRRRRSRSRSKSDEKNRKRRQREKYKSKQEEKKHKASSKSHYDGKRSTPAMSSQERRKREQQYKPEKKTYPEPKSDNSEHERNRKKKVPLTQRLLDEKR